jgi:hypothetical protein
VVIVPFRVPEIDAIDCDPDARGLMYLAKWFAAIGPTALALVSVIFVFPLIPRPRRLCLCAFRVDTGPVSWKPKGR